MIRSAVSWEIGARCSDGLAGVVRCPLCLCLVIVRWRGGIRDLRPPVDSGRVSHGFVAAAQVTSDSTA